MDDEGNPSETQEDDGMFRCAGTSFMNAGFQLTAHPKGGNEQQGHFMCLVNFAADSHKLELNFEYLMEGGAGLCAYLLDPSVEGWDNTFDGERTAHLHAGAVTRMGWHRHWCDGLSWQDWCNRGRWTRQHRSLLATCCICNLICVT